ncbi:hypothetical protein FGB62_56g116 [Gracilaria domingensis]|nr:hypothetical protein FGB62_56g116 [Gracilaria domingensis]
MTNAVVERECLENERFTAKSIVNNIVDSSSGQNDGSRGEIGGLRKEASEDANHEVLVEKKSSDDKNSKKQLSNVGVEEPDAVREDLNVWDLPSYVADLCLQEGYEYGVQFCKQVTKSKKYRLNVRLRCLRYKYSHPSCDCKAALMAKAGRDEQGWIVSASTMHNHERIDERRRNLSEKRKNVVKEAILKNCPDQFRIPFINCTPPALILTSKEAENNDEDFMDDLIPSRPAEVQKMVSGHNHVDRDVSMRRKKGNMGRKAEIIEIEDSTGEGVL